MSHKVVYNACYGGFELSLKAVDWLEENAKDESLREYIKQSLYNFKHTNVTTYASKNQLISYTISDYFRNKRHHKDLIAVVETLGYEAEGSCSELEIMEISGNQYRINEYDGFEEVITPEDSDWIIIND